jgi:NTE family protein
VSLHPIRPHDTSDQGLALVLSGGGARAAYQVGVLRYMASQYPHLAPGILTGVSAGGMIAMHLASRRGRFADSVAGLAEIWGNLRTEHVCGSEPVDLTSWITRWGLRLIGRGARETAKRRSLVGGESLRHLLTRTLDARSDGTLDGITRNLQSGAVRAVALTASSYLTGQSVTWVQSRGHFGALIGDGSRPERLSGGLGVDHVLASGALPFIFPAVEIDGAWYGDGGMRLTAPLSPAIELGARKIIAVSTRPSRAQGDAPRSMNGHPLPGQMAGTLLNAIFLDMLDADVMRIQQRNELIDRLPAGSRGDLQRTEVLVLRPSQDLGRLANEFEADLPRGLRFFARGGSGRTARSNDVLSLLMFQRDYILRLIELGESDARMQAPEIAAFLAPEFRPEMGRRRQVAVADETDTATLTRSWRKSLFDTQPVPALAG